MILGWGGGGDRVGGHCTICSKASYFIAGHRLQRTGCRGPDTEYQVQDTENRIYKSKGNWRCSIGQEAKWRRQGQVKDKVRKECTIQKPRDMRH
jgi:hypothetical protein